MIALSQQLRNMRVLRKFLVLSLFVCIVQSCRENIEVAKEETEQVGTIEHTSVKGFYLLNEGNMGSNKSTLDYYDFTTATYHRNIYPTANPDVVKELGDVGNDLQAYGSRLYAVINASNKVEVMDRSTGKRIGQVDIPNCRYIRFHEGYAYVTSYAGPIEITENYKQKGYVARFDTATLQIDGRCVVGYQPDELEIVGEKIYVANSGGYMVPNYENTVSVIDLKTFTETNRIEVAINLQHVRADRHGQLWVSSRGDYYSRPSKLYVIDPQTDQLKDSVLISVSNLCISGDSIYTCSTEFSYTDMTDAVVYGIVDTRTHKVVSSNFLATDNTQKIKKPYGIWVNPATGDIFLTDAKEYVTPGTLYCFSATGELRWSVRTGDIPAHFCPIGK